jgi:hypothetical protein
MSDQAQPIRDYLARIDENNAEECAALFSHDAVYVRTVYQTANNFFDPANASEDPSKFQLSPLRVYVGRDEIFELLRGRPMMPHWHEVRVGVTQGNTHFAEGRSLGGPYPDIVFMMHARTNGDGLIDRFVALASDVPTEKDGAIDRF